MKVVEVQPERRYYVEGDGYGPMKYVVGFYNVDNACMPYIKAVAMFDNIQHAQDFLDMRQPTEAKVYKIVLE